MQVQFNQYRYNYYPICYSSAPSFGGGISTMQEKLAVLITETKKLYLTKQNAGIKDFEAIIKKISPTTTVKPFSEIPQGSNVSPRTGAYFSQKSLINSQTNEMFVEDKVIYLNFDNSPNQPRLRLFGDFIHEATHIAQEESTDRLSTIKFVNQLLFSPISAEAKNNSLFGGVQGFKNIEYYILLPLIEAMEKNNDIPCRIPYADKHILNMIYQNLTQLPTTEYIKAVTKDIIQQLKINLPFADDNYILKYVQKKAGQEKEAYTADLDFTKDVLKINGDTDLDLRILLYDEFEKTIGSMIR